MRNPTSNSRLLLKAISNSPKFPKILALRAILQQVSLMAIHPHHMVLSRSFQWRMVALQVDAENAAETETRRKKSRKHLSRRWINNSTITISTINSSATCTVRCHKVSTLPVRSPKATTAKNIPSEGKSKVMISLLLALTTDNNPYMSNIYN